MAGHSRALPLSIFRLFIGPTLFSSFPPVPKRRILAVTMWCAKLRRRRVEPGTSVPSVWWRYMFQTVLGCITPQKILNKQFRDQSNITAQQGYVLKSIKINFA